MNGSKKEPKSNFCVKNAQLIADDIIDSLNRAEGSIKEKVYAVSHVLHALGETLYDREELDRKSVEIDYNESPTWAAGIMLASYIPHDLLQLLSGAREEHKECKVESKS